jgi:hypothetical protein
MTENSSNTTLGQMFGMIVLFTLLDKKSKCFAEQEVCSKELSPFGKVFFALGFAFCK